MIARRGRTSLVPRPFSNLKLFTFQDPRKGCRVARPFPFSGSPSPFVAHAYEKKLEKGLGTRLGAYQGLVTVDIDMAEGGLTGDEKGLSPELFESEGECSNLFRKEEDKDEWASNGIPPNAHNRSNSDPAAPRSIAGEGNRCHALEETKVAASPLMCRIGLNDNKAGMQGIDKARINQIILDASQGSKFYENEKRKEKQLTERVNHMLVELKKITPAQKVAARSVADRDLKLLEAGRDLSRIVVHIDMDAFYAAVEMRDNPHLKGVPMGVGSNAMLVGRGSGNRLCTCPYFT